MSLLTVTVLTKQSQ